MNLRILRWEGPATGFRDAKPFWSSGLEIEGFVSGWVCVHRGQALVQLPDLTVVIVVLGDELYAVVISVTVANKAPEGGRLIGIRWSELGPDLCT